MGLGKANLQAMGKHIRDFNLKLTIMWLPTYSFGGGYGTRSELVHGLWKSYGIKVRPMKISL